MASGEVTLTCCVSSVLQRKPQATTRPPTMDDPSLPVVPAAPGPAPSATAPRVPFHCSECGKSFRYRSDLRRHFARHTALKPHACPRCGKGFKHSFNLANHLRSHTGERPYRCSACPKGFRDSTGLLHHQVSLGSQTWPTYWDSIPLKEKQLEMPLARKFLSISPVEASNAYQYLQPCVFNSLPYHLENRSMYTQLLYSAVISFPYTEHRPSRELKEAFRKLPFLQMIRH